MLKKFKLIILALQSFLLMTLLSLPSIYEKTYQNAYRFLCWHMKKNMLEAVKAVPNGSHGLQDLRQPQKDGR